MRVLGVSYGYHDASACLVVDGAVVAAAAEERFTRQKHDASFPTYAIEHCLASGGLTTRDVDQVVFHEDPHAKFSRVLTAALAPFPRSRREFVSSTKAWLGRKLWSLGAIGSRLDVPPEKVRYLSHHFSHAVQAFMGSGQRESAIMVVDAVGDWACTALFRGEWVGGAPKIDRVLEVAYPNSLGLVYSAVTAYLGFSPNDSECSTMALAAFGRPIHAGTFREIVREVDDTCYEVDQSWFHFQEFYRGPVSEKFLRTFGPARDFRTKLPFDCLRAQGAAGPEISEDAQRFADVAASVQLVLEERLLALARRLHREVPSEHLCYAGGVSLNCVANQRLLVEGPFRSIYVPPDPGDGGTSVGAALYACAAEGGRDPDAMRYGPFVGPEFDAGEDVAMIRHVKPEHVRRYTKRGIDAIASAFHERTYEDRAELCAEVARRLLAGKIVGWYQGRGELGPRALGNRSIVVRPDDCALAARLSKHVKDRAAFRPYALSIAEEDAARVLDLGGVAPEHYRWMQVAAPVRAEERPRVAAALHVDGTTRPQICTAEQNPRWHQLLRAFGEVYGLAGVLNTSFNAAGYPLVSTPTEALAMFARTAMDVLVLDRTLVWKEHA